MVAEAQDFDLEIHVLDVRPQIPVAVTQVAADARITAEQQKPRDTEARRRSRRRELAALDGAVLPAALDLFDEFENQTNSYDEVAGRYRREPMSPGLGADVNADAYLDHVTNHGVFIEGIIDRLVTNRLQKSCVTRHSVAGTDGVVDDADLAKALEFVDAVHGPTAAANVGSPARNADSRKRFRIMSLSLSGYNDGDEPNDLLAQAIKQLQDNGWLIVAAAGNNASCRLAWPAALPGVVSVSGFGHSGPAWFSNFGPWVDACAPAVDVVSTFGDIQKGGLKVHDSLLASTFDTGYARWSGTRFAAPYVAALIARWIKRNRSGSQTGSAYAAAKNALILDSQAPRIPGYGTIVSEEMVRVNTTVSEI